MWRFLILSPIGTDDMVALIMRRERAKASKNQSIRRFCEANLKTSHQLPPETENYFLFFFFFFWFGLMLDYPNKFIFSYYLHVHNFFHPDDWLFFVCFTHTFAFARSHFICKATLSARHFFITRDCYAVVDL